MGINTIILFLKSIVRHFLNFKDPHLLPSSDLFEKLNQFTYKLFYSIQS